MKMLCLIPNCELPVYARGICCNHYQIARKRVKSGKITWHKLEKLRLARNYIPRSVRITPEKHGSEIALLYNGDQKKIDGHLERLKEKHDKAICKYLLPIFRTS
jgi:hypothetical protein